MAREYIPEHPEDRERRLNAEAEADRRIAAFAEEHHPELVTLLRTYSDEDAHELLDELREKFWGATVRR